MQILDRYFQAQDAVRHLALWMRQDEKFIADNSDEIADVGPGAFREVIFDNARGALRAFADAAEARAAKTGCDRLNIAFIRLAAKNIEDWCAGTKAPFVPPAIIRVQQLVQSLEAA